MPRAKLGDAKGYRPDSYRGILGAVHPATLRRPSAAAPRRVFLTGHQGPISGAAFDTKGRLISVGFDGTARRRAIRRDDLIELGRLKAGRNLTRTRWALDFER